MPDWSQMTRYAQKLKDLSADRSLSVVQAARWSGCGVGEEGHERNICTFCKTTGEKQMTMQVQVTR